MKFLNAKKIKTGLMVAVIIIIALSFVFHTRAKIFYYDLTRPKEKIPEALSADALEASTGILASVGEQKNENQENGQGLNLAETKEKMERVKDQAEEVKREINLPESLNLEVPFTSQAPQGNWKLPYQEACEEASMIMAAHFLHNKGGFTSDSANKEILDLISFEEKNGYAIDMTASETAEVVKKYFNLNAEIKTQFDANEIKKEIARGKMVILPFAGRELGNPNFTAPGPLYHMMVIKGYTPKVFITNDPGTRNGHDFQYTYDRILNVNHDWNGGNVKSGRKVMVVISK